MELENNVREPAPDSTSETVPEQITEQIPDTPQYPELPTDGLGYLIVRVTTAKGVIPLQGISVTVRNYNPETEEGRGAVVTTLVTDRSGNTRRFPLSAPPKELSERPGNSKPYSSYSIDIISDGYYEQYYTNVPIFDGVTSVQQVDLVPLAENGRTDSTTPDKRIFSEAENPNL